MNVSEESERFGRRKIRNPATYFVLISWAEKSRLASRRVLCTRYASGRKADEENGKKSRGGKKSAMKRDRLTLRN